MSIPLIMRRTAKKSAALMILSRMTCLKGGYGYMDTHAFLAWRPDDRPEPYLTTLILIPLITTLMPLLSLSIYLFTKLQVEQAERFKLEVFYSL